MSARLDHLWANWLYSNSLVPSWTKDDTPPAPLTRFHLYDYDTGGEPILGAEPTAKGLKMGFAYLLTHPRPFKTATFCLAPDKCCYMSVDIAEAVRLPDASLELLVQAQEGFLSRSTNVARPPIEGIPLNSLSLYRRRRCNRACIESHLAPFFPPGSHITLQADESSGRMQDPSYRRLGAKQLRFCVTPVNPIEEDGCQNEPSED
ncbi:hypothetical protein H1R20_g9502, partial [Candolleomyces eurysporus]